MRKKNGEGARDAAYTQAIKHPGACFSKVLKSKVVNIHGTVHICMNGNFVHLKKICEKNSSVNLRFEIFVTAFRVRELFGTFQKRAPGQ